MSEVRVKENESLDSALRRFKRSCAKSGVLAEVRKREHYESLLSDGRKSLRLHANANIDKVFPREKAGMLARFFLYPVL